MNYVENLHNFNKKNEQSKMQRSLNIFRYHRENYGTLTEKFVKHVYCFIKGEKEIKIYYV